jgi:hypothetical protein
MSNSKLTFSYVFEVLDFELHKSGKKCAAFSGKVFNNQIEYNFRQYVFLLKNGEWGLQDIQWDKHHPFLETDEFLQQLTNKAAKLLCPINSLYGEQSENGAKVIFNQKIAPKESLYRVFSSFRPEILSIPSVRWENIWNLIENRVNYDEHFRVQGFLKAEVIKAIGELKKIFPASWIKKQYENESQLKGLKLDMGMDFLRNSSPFWYPCFHLVRTAIGCICIDPAWNYLVELGLSVNRLKSFPGVNSLINSLTVSNGNQHHICLADDLNKRGLLFELEPKIANGSCKNDLSIKYNGQIIDLELKAFSSNSPSRSLIKEIHKKINVLPKKFDKPLIFHAILIENGEFNKERVELFYKSIGSVMNNLSENISAVVAGKIFVDATGGNLKRDSEKICINVNSHFKLLESDLKEIFKRNYEKVTYPFYGIGNFFGIGNYGEK